MQIEILQMPKVTIMPAEVLLVGTVPPCCTRLETCLCSVPCAQPGGLGKQWLFFPLSLLCLNKKKKWKALPSWAGTEAGNRTDHCNADELLI